MQMQWKGAGRAVVFSGSIVLAALLLGSSARGGDFYDNFGTPYLQRTETMTPDSGDSKEVNAATHTIDPWPRRVSNRRIPGNGERMSRAVERYRDVSKLPLAPQPLSPTAIGTSGPGSTSTTTTTMSTPVAQ